MSERGALLFRASADNTRLRYLWLSLGLGFAAVIIISARSSHKPLNWPMLVWAALFVTMFFTERRVSIYQNGIHFPRDSSGAQSRFIAWSQVERFHWDGDVLTIVPTSSVIGGSELGRPLLGGAIRVPMNKRVQLENILAGLAGKSSASAG